MFSFFTHISTLPFRGSNLSSDLKSSSLTYSMAVSKPRTGIYSYHDDVLFGGQFDVDNFVDYCNVLLTKDGKQGIGALRFKMQHILKEINIEQLTAGICRNVDIISKTEFLKDQLYQSVKIKQVTAVQKQKNQVRAYIGKPYRAYFDHLANKYQSELPAVPINDGMWLTQPLSAIQTSIMTKFSPKRNISPNTSFSKIRL